jgi:glycine cleavage system transcriptional repressor
MANQSNFLVLSALGKDKPGIIDKLAKIVFDLGCSIKDSRMSVLGGEFAILQLIEGRWDKVTRLEDQIPQIAQELGLTIICKRTEWRTIGLDLLPYVVEVVSMDNPGIVHKLANFFSTRNINIDNMSTSSYAAPHTGTSMFSVIINLEVPAKLSISELRDEFMEFCDSLNLDAIMEPDKK